MSNESNVTKESNNSIELNDSNECMLSTLDNPFNPFKQFIDWFMFDVEKGYYSCSKLDRIANVSDDMTEIEENAEIERAIDEIIKHDFMNIYVKVRKDTKTPVQAQ